MCGITLTSNQVFAASNDVNLPMLGYGYNITAGKEIVDQDAFNYASPILDVNNQKLYDSVKTSTAGSSTVSKNIVTQSATEMSTAYSNVVDAGISTKIKFVNANLNTLFSTQGATSNIKAERYELYYQETVKQTSVLQLELDELKELMSVNFKKDLYAVDSISDAKKLYEKYGTHLFTGFKLGGRMSITNYQASTKSSNDLVTSTSLESKLGVALGSQSAGTSFSFADQFGSSETSSTRISNYTFRSNGGASVGALTLDHLFTYKESILDGKGGYVYSEWTDSINNNESLAVLSVVDSTNTLMLYDFLPNTSEYNTTRKFLLNAYVEMCGDKYTEYTDQYPTLDQEIEFDPNNEFETSLIDGYYYTYNDFTEYVQSNTSNLSSRTVEFGAQINMNYEHTIKLDKLEWRVISGDGVDIIDSFDGIFEVTGNYGSSFEIGLYSDDTLIDFVKFNISSEKYSGGDGTESNPYIISNISDWKELSYATDDYNMHFVQINDLNFDQGTLMSIGSASFPFTGTYNGNGCVIYNFTIETFVGNSIAPFIYNKGTIKNLTIGKTGYTTSIISEILLIDAIGTQHVTSGGLVAVNEGTITDCSVINLEIDITFHAYRETNQTKYQIDIILSIGGVVGFSLNGKIQNCMVTTTSLIAYANGAYQEEQGKALQKDVNAEAGGIVGRSSNSTITNCIAFSMSLISTKTYSRGQGLGNPTTISSLSGGVVGYSMESSILSNCIAVYDNLTIISTGSFCNSNDNFNISSTNISNVDSSTISNSFYQENDLDTSGVTGATSKNVISYINLSYELDDSVWSSSSTGLPVITSQDNSSKRILVDLTNVKRTFYLGESFSINNIDINIIDGGNYASAIKYFKFETDFNSAQEGIYNVTIFANNLTYSYNVTVEKINIDSIRVESSSMYEISSSSDTLSVDQFETSIILENGEKLTYDEYISRTDVNIDNTNTFVLTHDTLYAGENLITISFGDFESSTVLKAVNKVVVSLEISNVPSVDYKIGASYELDSDIIVIITFADGTTMEVDHSYIEVISTIISEGENEVILAYDGYIYSSYNVSGANLSTKEVNVIIIVLISAIVVVGVGAVFGIKYVKNK